MVADTEERRRLETPDSKRRRREYWTNILRPILAARAFLRELRSLVVKKRDASYSQAMRDKALDGVEDALDYFDVFFDTRPGM